jgi:serine/threonine protein kinase
VGGIYRTADGKVQRILYYVMKIEEYGELFRVINQTEQFTEKTARVIFRQLISALRHIHSRRIAHCDIKSENILMDSKFNLKLVDFGYARYFVN